MATSILPEQLRGYKGRVAYIGANSSVTINIPARLCLVTVINNYYGNYDVLLVCQKSNGNTLVINSLANVSTRWSYTAVNSSQLTVTSAAYDGSICITVIGQ